jgi:hypothetical protein
MFHEDPRFLIHKKKLRSQNAANRAPKENFYSL